MKKFIIATFILSTMSFNAYSKTVDTVSFSEIVAEAKANHATAKEMQNIVWKKKALKKPFVEHFLAKADEAMKKGDEDAAMGFATQALTTSRGELRQAKLFGNIQPAWIK